MTGLADGVVDEHVRYDKRHPLLTTPMSAASRLDHLTCRRPPAHLYQPQKPHRVQPSRSSSQPASQSIKSINWPAAPHPITLSPALITADAHPVGAQCLYARAAQAEPKSGSRRLVPDQKSNFHRCPPSETPRESKTRGTDAVDEYGRT